MESVPISVLSARNMVDLQQVEKQKTILLSSNPVQSSSWFEANSSASDYGNNVSMWELETEASSTLTHIHTYARNNVKKWESVLGSEEFQWSGSGISSRRRA